MLLVNLENTSDNRISIDWIDYYKENLNYCGQLLYKAYFDNVCPNCRKKVEKLVGAHVGQIVGCDRRPYIIPLCDSCNTAGGIVEVPRYLPLVLVPSDSPHYEDIVYPSNMSEIFVNFFRSRIRKKNRYK